MRNCFQLIKETLHDGSYHVFNRLGQVQKLEAIWPRLQPGALLFRLDGYDPLPPETAALLSPDALIVQRR